MKNNDVRKLAKLTISGSKINRDVSSFALRKLSRRGLLQYLNHLKVMVEKQTVRVTSEVELSNSVKTEIKKLFEGKQVIFENEKIGEGIRVQISDTIIDFSMPAFIELIISRLKSSN